MDKKVYQLDEEAVSIIRDLYREFEKEENSLKVQYDNNSSKMEELEENILSFMKNEDIDYKVFSPRSVVSTNKEKIENLRKEKDEIEKNNKSVLKQMKYYSDKTKKLEYLFELLQSDEHGLEEQEREQVQESSFTASRVVAAEDSISNLENAAEIEKKEEVSNKLPVVEQENKIVKNETVFAVSLPSDLERINHKLELCCKFIDNDLIRTKIQLKEVTKNLSDIITSIK